MSLVIIRDMIYNESSYSEYLFIGANTTIHLAI